MTNQTAAPSLISVRSAAEHCSVSEATVRRWISAGTLPSLKVGGRRLIRVDDLAEFVDHGGSASHGSQTPGQAKEAT
jgi:excisionase family DNA binding protein